MIDLNEAGAELLAILAAEEEGGGISTAAVLSVSSPPHATYAEAYDEEAEDLDRDLGLNHDTFDPKAEEVPSVDAALAALRLMPKRVIFKDDDTVVSPDTASVEPMPMPEPNTGLEDHPYANLFPLMSDAELQELAADIKANGQQELILLYEGLILDGRNRYRACKLAGVEPKLKPWEGLGSALDYVVSLNLHRRHLTDQQRAFVAADVKASKTRSAGQPSKESRKPEGKEKSQICDSAKEVTSQVAGMLQVAPRAIEQAQFISNKGVPEVIEAAKANEILLSKAVEIARLPASAQAGALGIAQESNSEAQIEVFPEDFQLSQVCDNCRSAPEVTSQAASLLQVATVPSISDQFRADMKTLHEEFKSLSLRRMEKGFCAKVHKLAETVRLGQGKESK